MDTKQKNNLKAAGLALVLAGGTGVARVIEGVQKQLHKLSEVLAVNIADLRRVADAAHEEAADNDYVAIDGK